MEIRSVLGASVGGLDSILRALVTGFANIGQGRRQDL
jgi:hypothetical protein